MNEMSDFLSQNPWESELFYQHWLAQTYNFVCHSTRIVALAGALFPYDKNAFHLSAIEHLTQERNHEKMLVRDLSNFGKKIEEFPILHQSSIFYQTQYYWIEHVNPISVYGYYLFLEGLAAEIGPKVYDRLKSVYSEKCITFMKVHAHEDPHHIQEHLNGLSKVSQNEQDLIIKNFVQSMHIYKSLLNEIKVISGVKIKQAA